MQTQTRDYTYKNRNDFLKSIGYSSYSDYLSSGLWKAIRGRVIQRSKGICEICKQNKVTHVHHLNYDKDTLLGKKENMQYLVASCEECHIRIEFDQNGNKRGFQDVAPAMDRVKSLIGKGFIKPNTTKITNQEPTRLQHRPPRKKKKKKYHPPAYG